MPEDGKKVTFYSTLLNVVLVVVKGARAGFAR